ncbi:hypothetical protein [Roseovarius sp. M141]|uniref:hypothetical protein n=1 Tax=Roseovarius sp. M141 TaxID=2583806 RepID=UPI0020CFCFCA|nr:hypothetical protein [Roseovarius sp. M141]MCQ0092574.1 hypothetical protein [Roseovarius sp. M141]
MICPRSSPADAAPHRQRAVWRLGVLCAGALALAGCNRTNEADLRALLAGWLPLGETMSFAATGSCAAGLFQVVDSRIASRMRIANSVREAAMILKSHDQVAIVASRLTPDAALLELIEIERPTGMQMRLAGLEGRACMDPAAEAAFAAALVNPAAVVLMDRGTGVLALMDVEDGLLIAAMGAE